ncbi:MAG: hypothetical protein SWZ49_07270, partial [Cyanobacteriota bacterium]|nr:hypothetical protein [Cyanobacteriota bacterium]
MQAAKKNSPGKTIIIPQLIVGLGNPEPKYDNTRQVWYGKDRPISKVAPPEVAGYAEALGSSVCDAPRRLAPLKS